MNEQKLKRAELKGVRDKMVKHQNYRCPLCVGTLTLTHANLDHDHSSGRIRFAVHPECNILLGKIENFLKRYPRGLSEDIRVAHFLSNAHAYMGADYSGNAFHPRHMTTADKERKRVRALIKKSKRPETKAKWRKVLKEVQDEGS